MNKKISVKVLVIALVVIMLATGIIGGTLAWLVDQTDSVVNTFTYGDINIDLEETPTPDDDDNPDTNEYEMIPGEDVVKDPKVTVKEDSKANWLFVKLEKSENFDDFMEYEMAAGWIPLKDAQGEVIEGVYYREVAKAEKNVEFAVIKDNKVTVKGDVTKEMLNALDADGKSDYPKLVVTAYAVQRDADIEAINTAAEAWALVK